MMAPRKPAPLSDASTPHHEGGNTWAISDGIRDKAGPDKHAARKPAFAPITKKAAATDWRGLQQSRLLAR